MSLYYTVPENAPTSAVRHYRFPYKGERSSERLNLLMQAIDGDLKYSFKNLETIEQISKESLGGNMSLLNLLDDYHGIDQSGLVCWHDLYAPNVLTNSSNFASWSKHRAGLVQSATVVAPSGSTAWKLVEDSTAANTHSAAFNTGSSTVGNSLAISAKPAERTQFSLYLDGISDIALFDLEAVTATGSGSIKSLGDGWYRCEMWGDVKAERCGVMLAVDGSITYDGTGTDPYTEADPGIYITDVQLYPSSTLPPYAATTDLQTFADLSGHGYSLQRGSTAGADSNDPTVLGPGLSFVTDDYALTGNLSGVDMAGDWTAVLVLIQTGSEVAKYPWCLGVADDLQHFAGLRQTGVANQLTVRMNQISASDSPAITTSSVSPQCLSVRAVNGTAVLTRLDTNESAANPIARYPVGIPRIAVGNIAYLNAALDSGTIYSHLFFSRALSNAEIQRIYRLLKATWAARGVTIL